MIKLKDYFNKSVKLFELDVHTDNRGFFFELYSQKKLRKFGIKEKFVQDNFSYSKNIYTIRGMHFQKKPYAQSKLIYVHQGAIQDIIIDIRKNSNTFGKYKKVLLSDKNKKILYLPEGFAGGYHCLDNENLVLYHHNEFFYKKFDEGFNVFSKNFDLKISNKVIRSNKDKNLRFFEEIKSRLLK